MKKKAIGIILLCAAAIFMALAIKEEMPYIQSQKKHKEIREKYIEVMDGKDEDTEEDMPAERKIDFQALQNINSDIIGWIYIPGTQVDYPILCGTHYLHYDYSDTYNILGSILMPEGEDASFAAEHTILYGHNMKDGQMFGSLSMYAKQEVRDSQPYVYIYLPEQTLRCTVYSAYECMDGTETYQITYADSQAYAGWLEMTVAASNYRTTLPEITDRILTLSTCTDTGNARFVVHSIIDQIN